MMITCTKLTKRYPGGCEVLSQVDFDLEKGSMVFLTGPSGAGKSTFLKLLALLEYPTSGSIVVNGAALHALKKREIAAYRAHLGIALQTPHLLSDRSVFDNVALPLLIQGLTQTVIAKRVHAALDMVGLLPKQTLFPMQLSGGEQQRVGIARAVVHKPVLLLADEPTGNLDPSLSYDIMSLFEQLNQAGVTVLVATHDLALIAGMRHRIILLKGGRLC